MQLSLRFRVLCCCCYRFISIGRHYNTVGSLCSCRLLGFRWMISLWWLLFHVSRYLFFAPTVPGGRMITSFHFNALHQLYSHTTRVNINRQFPIELQLIVFLFLSCFAGGSSSSLQIEFVFDFTAWNLNYMCLCGTLLMTPKSIQ